MSPIEGEISQFATVYKTLLKSIKSNLYLLSYFLKDFIQLPKHIFCPTEEDQTSCPTEEDFVFHYLLSSHKEITTKTMYRYRYDRKTTNLPNDATFSLENTIDSVSCNERNGDVTVGPFTQAKTIRIVVIASRNNVTIGRSSLIPIVVTLPPPAFTGYSTDENLKVYTNRPFSFEAIHNNSETGFWLFSCNNANITLDPETGKISGIFKKASDNTLDKVKIDVTAKYTDTDIDTETITKTVTVKILVYPSRIQYRKDNSITAGSQIDLRIDHSITPGGFKASEYENNVLFSFTGNLPKGTKFITSNGTIYGTVAATAKDTTYELVVVANSSEPVMGIAMTTVQITITGIPEQP
jgi:hypothetical protein